MSQYTNHLINETSPYLLQHAHNPVNWFPWGEEALQKAKTDDKPILVSIGYSACHWCHVMEKESFEKEDTAKLMNDNFINIKIDREERPDLDHIYMDAVQAMGVGGGWPLNVFLTPDLKPFYGGTYFPPVKAYNRASWSEILLGVSRLFKEKRSEVEAQADQLTQHLNEANGIVQSGSLLNVSDEQLFTKQQANTIFENIMKQADKTWGGFGNAPKFPQTFTINCLLRYYHFTKNAEALQQACLSLDKMIQGGIYDHIGGGFARYSTDTEWLAPHFEKMLYDNALIISTLCDAYQLTKNENYREVVDNTIKFIERELMNEDGGFYSALDADSEGVEGKYYVWSYEEVQQILGDDAKLFCEYYDISPGGNWEHTNILRVLKPVAIFSAENDIDEVKLKEQLKTSAFKLLNERNKRIKPGTDDKILLGWNALMNIALSKASASFANSSYKEMAIRNFNFLWLNFKTNNDDFSLHHTCKNNTAKYPAFLDDYAYMIQACIDLQEITSDTIYLQYARSLTEYVFENFKDEQSNYFFYTGKQQADVIVRKREIYDGAIPSGNSVMAANLIYLSVIYDNDPWKQKGIALLYYLSEVIVKYPTSFGNWACLMIWLIKGTDEIVITGKEFEKLRDELLQHFIPGKVLQSAYEVVSSEYPLLNGKNFLSKTLIYLCRNYSCKAPVSTVVEVINQLDKGVKID